MTPGAQAPLNNFNVIRLVAAWLVLFSHSYHLVGQGGREPLMALTGGKMTLGTLAVGVFFVISGYLITASAYARPGLRPFLAARVRRIFPALALVVLLCALVLGPVMTTLAGAEYFAAPAVLTYVARNLTLWRLQYELPGVFAANPYGAAVNGSLWTLPIEFALYLAIGCGVAALRLIGRARDLALPLAALGLACVAGWALVLHGTRSGAALLVPYFMLGAGYRLARRWLPLRGALAALLLLVWAVGAWRDAPWFPVAACLAISYGTLWLALHPRWVVPLDTARVGDLSYGIYLFAFPWQQTLLALLPQRDPLVLCALASLATLPCAWLSWHLVEQRFVAMPRAERVPAVRAEGVR